MLDSPLAAIGTVLGIALLLGAVYSAFRSSDLRTTVKDQSALIETLRTQREELKGELAEEKSERSLLDKRLELAEKEIDTLKEIVSGRIDFSSLETALAHHHSEALKRHDEVQKEMRLGFKDLKALVNAKREGDK